MSSPNFRTEFDPRHGEAVELVPGLSRVVCENPSAFTFHGTNTYILGEERVAVIDPGPLVDSHFDALLGAIGGRTVSHIIVTHTHADHSPLAKELQAKTGAPMFAEGPHRAARALNIGETNPLDASADMDFKPDHALAHGDLVEGDGWTLTALHTPGHTANHLAFAWKDTDYLFPGDHVMAWATSIVAPPDGAMADYMASLEVLLAQDQEVYFPGHGGRLDQARSFTRALRAHRKMREQAVLDQVRKGKETIPEMVAVIYRTTDKKLHGAAGLSVLAHMEDLVARGVVACNGAPGIDSVYRPA
ncbi:MBL fold metallo-hydrolase [Pseudahrensia aquimaris]|uniref:MBL fold metallo-hydrolase n=1 Tax=Pseudahrensia aquimaris TaxID=744461 RepID=A0ABW3FHR3_9HYPH